METTVYFPRSAPTACLHNKKAPRVRKRDFSEQTFERANWKKASRNPTKPRSSPNHELDTSSSSTAKRPLLSNSHLYHCICFSFQFDGLHDRFASVSRFPPSALEIPLCPFLLSLGARNAFLLFALEMEKGRKIYFISLRQCRNARACLFSMTTHTFSCGGG